MIKYNTSIKLSDTTLPLGLLKKLCHTIVQLVTIFIPFSKSTHNIHQSNTIVLIIQSNLGSIPIQTRNVCR